MSVSFERNSHSSISVDRGLKIQSSLFYPDTFISFNLVIRGFSFPKAIFHSQTPANLWGKVSSKDSPRIRFW